MLFLLLIIGVMTTCYILFKLQDSGPFIVMHILGKELHLYGWIMWDILEQSQDYWTATMTV